MFRGVVHGRPGIFASPPPLACVANIGRSGCRSRGPLASSPVLRFAHLEAGEYKRAHHLSFRHDRKMNAPCDPALRARAVCDTRGSLLASVDHSGCLLPYRPVNPTPERKFTSRDFSMNASYPAPERSRRTEAQHAGLVVYAKISAAIPALGLADDTYRRLDAPATVSASARLRFTSAPAPVAARRACAR